MASNVTMQFFKDSISSSTGIAVISFDLPSTLGWPSTKPCSLALTRCNGPCARPKDRRRVLPSIATTSRSNASAKFDDGGPRSLRKGEPDLPESVGKDRREAGLMVRFHIVCGRLG